jgi:hypothetical protein
VAQRPDLATVKQLRDMALDAVKLGLPAPPAADHPTVAGAVVDIASDEQRFATLVAMGEGSTSLYTSGASYVGTGGWPEVSEATHSFLRALEPDVSSFEIARETSFPPQGTVRIDVLPRDGRRYCDVPEAEFWGQIPSPRRAIIAAIHDVITAVRARAMGPKRSG